MQKRILILTAGFGEGHNAAARGMQEGLAEVSGGAAKVELRDLFADSFGMVNTWARKAYLTAINHFPQSWGRFYNWLDRQEEFAPKMRWLFLARARLGRLLQRFQPSAVVSVFPAYPYLLESILDGSRAPFRRIICITDSITVNAIWYRAAADLFFVPNELTAAILDRVPVPRELVRVTGFPVSTKFASLGDIRRPPSQAEGYRILYVINAGGLVAPDVIRGLASMPGVKLTVTVGRDQHLRGTVEALRAETGSSFEIVGWTDQLPRMMSESHLLISKAGGATTQEAIAAKCPMIVNQIVPGQEEGNARLIAETNCGVIATDSSAILKAAAQAFAHDLRTWREWSANIARLSRPRAALEIASLLLTL
jgi:processive 1,2-diacylglycerol beta-glucosyltransferase